MQSLSTKELSFSLFFCLFSRDEEGVRCKNTSRTLTGSSPKLEKQNVSSAWRHRNWNRELKRHHELSMFSFPPPPPPLPLFLPHSFSPSSCYICFFLTWLSSPLSTSWALFTFSAHMTYGGYPASIWHNFHLPSPVAQSLGVLVT